METMFTIWHNSLENQPDTWQQLDYMGPLLVKGQQFVLTRIDLLWIWIFLLCPPPHASAGLSSLNLLNAFVIIIMLLPHNIASRKETHFGRMSKAVDLCPWHSLFLPFPHYAETADLLENCSGLLKTQLWHHLKDTAAQSREATQ